MIRNKEIFVVSLRFQGPCIPEFLVDVLFVEAQFVKHANEEAVLFLGVVLALICSVGDAQLVEWCTISAEKTFLFKNEAKLRLKLDITWQF